MGPYLKTKPKQRNKKKKKADVRGAEKAHLIQSKAWDTLSLHALFLLHATYQHSIFSSAKVLARFQPGLYGMNKRIKVIAHVHLCPVFRAEAQSLELGNQNVRTDKTLQGEGHRGCLKPWSPALLGPPCHPIAVMSLDCLASHPCPLMLIRCCLPVHSTWVVSWAHRTTQPKPIKPVLL